MTDERFMALVADRIRGVRKSRGRSQWDMQDFGFNYRYYQMIESGTVNLTLKTLNRLANAFGVSAVEFIPPEAPRRPGKTRQHR